ncbi:sodium-dependent proline transporter-like isoform X1 [Mizuhopecten yessoensis]|uniref:sodium-dependent proline transporter-like isoform X1 n=1 Tax=Mizuhopecten yessoensis TaxID=6573 RepID=UPI000B45A755|nr:sodium-dependent proline transporter-like isoform X1 [Mizuhopecten yessoensis]
MEDTDPNTGKPFATSDPDRPTTDQNNSVSTRDVGKAEEEPERGNWTGKLDFLLSCIGYAVGLGNVWRFPYLCYRNGGGAFLVPYVIMLLVAGLPLFFLELCVGQFSSQGPVTAWALSPLFMGIGWAMILISAMVCTYYNVIIMYAVYYMFVSFVNLDDELPWQKCGKAWNTDKCRDEPYPDLSSMNETMKVNATLGLKDQTCLSNILGTLSTLLNQTFTSVSQLNSTVLADHTEDCDIKFATASSEYWNRYVLRVHESDGLEDIGSVSLKNVLCLLICWLFIFFCLMKGVKSSGKVVYFTATFPYVVLLILLIRGVTLPGYYKGIEFYIFPKWELLKNPKVWGDAATQIFYSLGPAFGGLLTMASYNKFNNNCLRDAVIVSFINCGTSVFAGFAIFSLLGYISHTTNVPIDKVADSGPGLAFIAYPEGIAKLPSPPIFAFLFFFMLFTLGLDSQFAMMETVISGITDVFPRQLRSRKALFTFFCCMVGFVLGIPQTCKGGIYLLTLVDWYSGSYNLMIVSFVEIVGIIYVYGINNFRQDIELMLGKKSPIVWAYFYTMWFVVTPLAIFFIVIMMAINYSPAVLGDYTFPPFAEAIGWMMVLAPLMLIIIGAIVQIVRKGGVSAAIKSEPHWGPSADKDRKGPRYAPIQNLQAVPGGNGHFPSNVGYNSDKGNLYMVGQDNKGMNPDAERL